MYICDMKEWHFLNIELFYYVYVEIKSFLRRKKEKKDMRKKYQHLYMTKKERKKYIQRPTSGRNDQHVKTG